jgi:hypothetical protein
MIFGQGWIRQRTTHGFLAGPAAGFAFCNDCAKRSKGCIADWYMVKRAVWEQAWPGTASRSAKDVPMKHFLCIPCLERRLNRRLTRRDFDMRRAANDLKRERNMPMSPLFRRRLRTRP